MIIHELREHLLQVFSNQFQAKKSDFLATSLPFSHCDSSLPTSHHSSPPFSVLFAPDLRQGYEGSGNGFLVRALPRLRRLRPALQVYELKTSWRWTEGCPLEAARGP